MAKDNFNGGATRCKPGDRAKVIKAANRENIGLVVVVVRPYRDNELIDGSSWHHDGNAWVVVSLGSQIVGVGILDKELSTNRTAVFNDACLVPLDDDDAGTGVAVSKKKPRAKKQTAAIIE